MITTTLGIFQMRDTDTRSSTQKHSRLDLRENNFNYRVMNNQKSSG